MYECEISLGDTCRNSQGGGLMSQPDVQAATLTDTIVIR